MIKTRLSGNLEDLEAILESVDRLEDMYDAIKGTQKVIAEKYGKNTNFTDRREVIQSEEYPGG